MTLPPQSLAQIFGFNTKIVLAKIFFCMIPFIFIMMYVHMSLPVSLKLTCLKNAEESM